MLHYLQLLPTNIFALWIQYLPNKKTGVDIGRLLPFRSWEYVFGVTTKLWDTKFAVRFLLRPDLFVFPKRSDCLLFPPNLLFSW